MKVSEYIVKRCKQLDTKRVAANDDYNVVVFKMCAISESANDSASDLTHIQRMRIDAAIRRMLAN